MSSRCSLISSNFFLQDEAAIGDLSDSWDNSAVDRLIAIAPGTIGVGTVRNMNVPVVIEIYDQEPDDDFSEWDYVIEAGLDVPSGRIVVAGCTDYVPDALRLDVPPGSYRARMSYGALDALSEDPLSGDDHYRVQIWPDLDIGILVRKQRA